MKPLTAPEIRGNWATLLCAWNTDGSLDIGRVEAEIDALVSAGVDGIYSNGTAGEFHVQTENEFDLISRTVADRCDAAGLPFQIGVSHPIPQVSLARLERTVGLAPSAVQFILPDWFPLTDEEAYAFVARMAEVAGEVGLVLYNPPHAKRVLTPAEIGKLASRVSSLVGLKTAAGDEAWYAAMREHIPGLSVFVPGAAGAYSNVACLNPTAAQRWTDQMTTDMPGALELESRIQRFMSEYIAPFITRERYCNAAADRFMANVGGWADVGLSMRFPYRSIPESELSRVRAAAAQLIPEFV
jgi:4-hydroxy-tetrahydrodipicolinate synthase